MDMDRLRSLRLASPFRPFYLLTSDGKRYFIDKPYHLGMAPDASRFGVVSSDASVRLLWPEQLIDVDVLPEN